MIEQYWQRCRDQACSAITGSTVSAPAFLLAACCHGTRAMKPLILNSSLGYIPKGILKQKRETERKKGSNANKVSNGVITKMQNQTGLNIQSQNRLSKFSIATQQDSMKLLKTIAIT